jgi:hypothetical protein
MTKTLGLALVALATLGPLSLFGQSSGGPAQSVRIAPSDPTAIACVPGQIRAYGDGGFYICASSGFYVAPAGSPGPPMDINALTEQTAPTVADDEAVIYDAGLTALRKVKLVNMPYPALTISGSDPAGACTVGKDRHWNSTSWWEFVCGASGTWQRVGKVVKLSGEAPTTLAVGCNEAGEIGTPYYDTDAGGSAWLCTNFSGSPAWTKVVLTGSSAALAHVTVTTTGAGTGIIAKNAVGTVAGDPFLGVHTSAAAWSGGLLGNGKYNHPGLLSGAAKFDSDGTLQKVTGTASNCVKVDGSSGSCGDASVSGDEYEIPFVAAGGGALDSHPDLHADADGNLTVPSINITNASSGGSVKLTESATDPTGEVGTGTIHVDSDGDLAFIKDAGSSVKVGIVGGHIAADSQIVGFSLTDNASLGAKAITTSCVNHASTGTTVNRIAKIVAGVCETATISDVEGDVWVVTGGAGTTGSAEIAVGGTASCVFTGAAAANTYVTVGASGKCTGDDTPTAGYRVLGRLLEAVSGADETKTFLVDPFTWPSSSSSLPSGPGFVYVDAMDVASVDDTVMRTTDMVTAAQLPTPGVAAAGGVLEVTCGAGQFINKVDGTSTCGTPATAPVTFFQAVQTTSTTGSTVPATFCRLYSQYIPIAVEFSHIGFKVVGADSVGGITYSIGLGGTDPDATTYTDPATRLAYITFGSAAITATGLYEVAIAGGGTATIDAGWYAWAWCASADTAGTATFGVDNNLTQNIGRFAVASANVQTAGVLNASFDIPAQAVSQTTRPYFWLIKK